MWIMCSSSSVVHTYISQKVFAMNFAKTCRVANAIMYIGLADDFF